MKVLYVITKANWGGAQRYVYDLAVAATNAGHEVSVAVGGTGVLTERLEQAEVKTIHLHLHQKSTFFGDLFAFGPLFSLLHLCRSLKPDVVHVNSAKAGGLGALAARLSGVPRIIFTAHGWEFNAPRNFFSKLGIRFFNWLTLLLAHETICVSEAIRRDIRHFPFVQKKLSVIHLGIECSPLLLREEARAELAPHAVGRYWIGMISELHPTKRVDDAIRACAVLAERYPEAILVIMGEGRERERLEELVRELHVRDHVSLAGFQANAPSLLKAFDLFVHTSQSEALGYAILEAGCASLPVVATRVGGIPEIITDDDHGLLVPPHKSDALAAAMDSLMRDGARAAELGARLHARVHTAFSKDRMLNETFAHYVRNRAR